MSANTHSSSLYLRCLEEPRYISSNSACQMNFFLGSVTNNGQIFNGGNMCSCVVGIVPVDASVSLAVKIPAATMMANCGYMGISLIKSELNAQGPNIWSNLRMYLPFLVNIVPLHLLKELLPTNCGSDIKLMCQTHVSNWVFHGRLLHLSPSCNATLEWRYNIRVLGWLLKSLNLITASGSFSDEPVQSHY